MDYAQETLSQVVDEAVPLLTEHFKEVHPLKDVFPLDMDWGIYHQIESAGLIRIYTAREEGKLVGYMLVMIHPNLQSKGTWIPHEDGLFVAPEYRNSSVGKSLIKYAEDCLITEGFKVLYIVGTEAYPLDNFVGHIGYTKVETKFKKVL